MGTLLGVGIGAAGELREFFHRRYEQVKEDMSRLPAEEVRFSSAAVISQLVDKYRLDPLHLHADQVHRSEVTETTRQMRNVANYQSTVHEQKITLWVPVGGEVALLRYRASTSRTDSRDMRVMGGHVEFDFVAARLTLRIVSDRLADALAALAEYVAWVNQDLAGYENAVRQLITSQVEGRKQRLNDVAEVNAALTIPVAPSPPGKAVPLPVKRRQVRIIDTRTDAGGIVEPFLDDKIYEDVLRTLAHLGRTAERLPTTTAKLKEEELRDILLFILNANYEGTARGEVFNHKGKTDILIPHGGRNAFIAECKVWGGPRRFSDGLDQLLGRYLAWRDTKGAMILFIKKGNPSYIIETAAACMKRHRGHRLSRAARHPMERQDFQFASLLDDRQRIQVALLPIVVTTVVSSA